MNPLVIPGFMLRRLPAAHSVQTFPNLLYRLNIVLLTFLALRSARLIQIPGGTTDTP